MAQAQMMYRMHEELHINRHLRQGASPFDQRVQLDCGAPSRATFLFPLTWHGLCCRCQWYASMRYTLPAYLTHS